MSPTKQDTTIIKEPEGGVAQKERFVYRDADGFFRNEHGQKDLHLVFRAVCIVIAASFSVASIGVFLRQAFGVIPVDVDPLPYFYNSLFFMLTALGDAALNDGILNRGRKK